MTNKASIENSHIPILHSYTNHIEGDSFTSSVETFSFYMPCLKQSLVSHSFVPYIGVVLKRWQRNLPRTLAFRPEI